MKKSAKNITKTKDPMFASSKKPKKPEPDVYPSSKVPGKTKTREAFLNKKI